MLCWVSPDAPMSSSNTVRLPAGEVLVAPNRPPDTFLKRTFLRPQTCDSNLSIMDVTHTRWWLAPAPEPLARGAGPAAGLSAEEARTRLQKDGPNLFRQGRRRSLLVQYLMRFGNPLVLILLAASAVSAFTGETSNFIIISAIVLLSVTLDFVQEYRANAAAEKLRLSVSLRATALRNGQPVRVPVADVVRGDVLLLSAGDLIPADCRVLEATDFFVKQALLTGESYPVEKRPDNAPDSAPELLDARNAVFMGTSVVSGSARVLVVETGDATVMGEIAGRVAQPSEPTSVEIGTRRFGMLIMRLTLLMVTFVLLVNTLFHKPLLETFLFAVALAVGLTPELLPMVVSVTLSRGALRMARKHTIVKRLSAIQDLGSMDVLCTDKTGTLTEATIRLESHVDAQGKPSERVFELAYLNSFFESGLKSSIDAAILDHAKMDTASWNKIDEVPFDFERRRVSVLLDDGSKRWLVAKGAPDDIVALCTHYHAQEADQQLPLDGQALAAARDQYHELERQGYRVLAIAWRHVPPDHPHAIVDDETELVLAGFAAFIDPPKAGAASALAALNRSGIAIKIVTGDSDLVTRHVCAQLGIPVAGVLTGSEIAQMDDYALQARAEKANLFCRVNPSQKNRVILALRARGHVVGYLGDGINDAPSLHSADVGLSVDSAVDVAKEAADIILLQHDLRVLHAGVLEGRRTFGNILKYIMMGTSSNFGNMFSMAGASLFLPFLPMLPTQILLNNVLYDISEIAIPLDQVDTAEIRTPRTLDITFVRNFMLIVGPISSLFDFLMFYILLVVLKADEQLFQTGWFVESLCTQVLVIFIIRTRGSPLKSHPHPLLTATSIAVVGVAALLPFLPVGGFFGMVPPPAKFYLMLVAMVLFYLFIVEWAKQAFYRRISAKHRPRGTASPV
jgi:Mg2+-importing ATPase